MLNRHKKRPIQITHLVHAGQPVNWDRVFTAAEKLNRTHLFKMAEDSGLTVRELEELTATNKKSTILLSTD